MRTGKVFQKIQSHAQQQGGMRDSKFKTHKGKGLKKVSRDESEIIK